MLEYFKQLILSNEKQLCFHVIITQQNFTNTIHIDKDSNLSQETKNTITDTVTKTGKSHDPKVVKIYNFVQY